MRYNHLSKAIGRSNSRFLFTLLFLSVSIFAFGQRKKKVNAPSVKIDQTFSEAARWQAVYTRALNYNDYSVATEAVYHLLELQPERTQLRDTLARLYMERSAFSQCLLVSTEVLKEAPNNQKVLELAALSKKSLGLLKEALADYEKLFLASKDVYHLYEVAAIQYSMRRFGECQASIDKLLASPNLEDKVISLAAQNLMQEVPFRAACFNLNAVLEMDQNNPQKARKHFESALKLYPKFELARQNMAVLNKGTGR